MAIYSISSTTAIVPFLLEEDNYEDWRIYMENYLLAQDLWDIIESVDDADCPSSSNDVGNWRKKNAAALHAIHITSSSNIFAQIKGIRSAKDAWNQLTKMHQEWQSKSKPKTGGGVAMDAEIPLYIRISRPKDDKEEFGWYRADLKEGHVSDVTLIVDEDSRIPQQGITSVFVGSYLYVLGGNRGSDYTDHTHYTADVFSVNTKQPEEGWTMVSPMRCPRAYASAITVGGKIYVFGGMGGGRGCVGEVFDLGANSWDHLPLPHLPGEDFIFGGEGTEFPVQLDSEKEWILIRFEWSPYFFAYHFKEERWEIVNKYIHRLPSLIVFEDGVLYLLGNFAVLQALCAFDLNKGKRLGMVWSTDLELDPKVVKYSSYDNWSVMFHLGKGKLCLACNNVSVREKQHYLLIIEVGRRTDSEIEVSKVSCQRLHVDLGVVPKITYYLTP